MASEPRRPSLHKQLPDSLPPPRRPCPIRCHARRHRVQLVRRDGRDVSALYGRGGGAPAGAAADAGPLVNTRRALARAHSAARRSASRGASSLPAPTLLEPFGPCAHSAAARAPAARPPRAPSTPATCHVTLVQRAPLHTPPRRRGARRCPASPRSAELRLPAACSRPASARRRLRRARQCLRVPRCGAMSAPHEAPRRAPARSGRGRSGRTSAVCGLPSRPSPSDGRLTRISPSWRPSPSRPCWCCCPPRRTAGSCGSRSGPRRRGWTGRRARRSSRAGT